MEFNEVVSAVTAEIKTLGDSVSGIKTNYNEMRKSHEELKKVIENGTSDIIAREKLDKLASDVATRQDALDKQAVKHANELNERLDSFEVAMKRPGIVGQSDNAAYEEAKAFAIAHKSIMSGDTGFSYSNMPDVNVDNYKEYAKEFEKYIRTWGGDKQKLVEQAAIKTMISASDPDGGYTVPTAMSNKIIKRLYEIDPLRSLAAVESITTGAIEWLVDNGDAGSGWEGNETVATASATTPQLAKKRIPVNVLATRPRVSQILLEDSGINIEQFLATKVGDRFGRDEAAAFVSGDGINKPRGFLTYADGANWNQIEQVHMGNAASLTADGFITVKYHMIEQFLERGTWLLNRSTVQAALQLKDGAGNYLWQPSFMAGQPSTILGLPVRMSTSMPTVAANALAVVLADFKEAYMIVDRLGITVQRDPYTAKPLVEMYFRKRVGGDVVNFDAIKIGTIEA